MLSAQKVKVKLHMIAKKLLIKTTKIKKIFLFTFAGNHEEMNK